MIGNLKETEIVHTEYSGHANYWTSLFAKTCSYSIPKRLPADPEMVWHAANKISSDVQFTRDACARLVEVPRIFLNMALKGCVKWAEKNNVSLITEKEMELIRDARGDEIFA